MSEYQIDGRHLPTDAEPTPKIYRMRIFCAKCSRREKLLLVFPKTIKEGEEGVWISEKNFRIWLRYDSRSRTHNMYKEHRELTRADAVKSMYQDMAARHRARFRSIHILRVVEIEKTDDIKRPYIKQLLVPKLKFPLPHRVFKTRSTFLANRPSTI